LQTKDQDLSNTSEEVKASYNDVLKAFAKAGSINKKLSYPGLPGCNSSITLPNPKMYQGKLIERVGPSGIKRTAQPYLRPIRWDLHKSHVVAGILSECEGIPCVGMIDKALRRAKYPRLRPHLVKLRDDLMDWEVHACKYAMSSFDIIQQSLIKGPDFFDYYKKEKRKAMYRGIGACDPVSGAYIHGQPNSDYWSGPDSWFDMRYSIFWDLTSDDHKYMFYEGTEDLLCDDGLLGTFRVSLSAVLPDSATIVEDVFDQYKTGSAKSFRPEEPDRKRDPEWLQLYGEYLPKDEYAMAKVKGVLIPKCAGETRDGVTMPPGTKRLLTKVGKAISQLIGRGPYRKRHPTGMEYSEVHGKLEHLSCKYGWFLCNDFEKIGLTLPTYVIVATLSECYQITEYQPFLEAIKLFKELEYHNDTEYLTILRGYCLGLFNEGMTLVQLALHHMSCSEIGVDHDGMFLNDDAVVGFETKEDAMEYAIVDNSTCLALGIPRKDSKSFLSKGHFVFCEEYFSDRYLPKNVLRSCAYNCCFYMPTIRMAKELYSSIAMNMGSDENKLLSLVEFWGYEFYEDEHLYPFEFGGWHHAFIEGYNIAANLYDNNFYCYWAYKAIRQKIKHKGKIGKMPTQPLGRAVDAQVGIPDEELLHDPLIGLEDIFGDKKAISFKRMQTAEGRDNSLWYALLKQRKIQAYFNKHFRSIPGGSLIDIMVKDGFMPPFSHLKPDTISQELEFEYNHVEGPELNNARLVLDFAKLGVVYNHPQLNSISVLDAHTTELVNMLNQYSCVPIRGLKSIKPTESNLKLVSFCKTRYDYFPQMEMEDDSLAMVAAWGSLLNPREWQYLVDLASEKTVMGVNRVTQILEDAVDEYNSSLARRDEEEAVSEEESEPLARYVLVRSDMANYSATEEGAMLNASDTRFLVFAADTTDLEIHRSCELMGVIALNVPYPEDEGCEEDMVNPFAEDNEDY